MAVDDSIREAIAEALLDTFDKALFVRLGKELAPLLELMVTNNAEEGRFTGGKLANEGYSTNPIQAWKLGKLERQGNGRWRINPSVGAIVTPSKDQLIWRHFGQSPPNALLLGGYKKYRELAGYQTSSVNLTVSGAMLNSVQARSRATTNGVVLRVGATGGQEEKAFYTDLQRNWLDLHPSQQKKFEDEIVDIIEKQIRLMG